MWSSEIFDRNDDVGGTWLTTTYPGIGVDTPSAYYSLSREVNPEWSSYYPQGGEYQEYLVALADKYRLREHARFRTEVEALWWDEDREQWQIHSVDRDGNRDISYARVVITAAGYLNRPRWPEVQGRDTFSGISIHSAQWDPSLDLTGKRVAIIGAGCTAVQIVDACVDEVEHLTVFQRQPHWVAPRKRASDDVPELSPLPRAPRAVLRELEPAEVLLGRRRTTTIPSSCGTPSGRRTTCRSRRPTTCCCRCAWSTSTGPSAPERNWRRR